jgi:hypothetical protein
MRSGLLSLHPSGVSKNYEGRMGTANRAALVDPNALVLRTPKASFKPYSQYDVGDDVRSLKLDPPDALKTST